MNSISPSTVTVAIGAAATAALIIATPSARTISEAFLRGAAYFTAHPQIPLALTAATALAQSMDISRSSDKAKALLQILAAAGLIKTVFSWDEEATKKEGIQTITASAIGLAGLTLIDYVTAQKNTNPSAVAIKTSLGILGNVDPTIPVPDFFLTDYSPVVKPGLTLLKK